MVIILHLFMMITFLWCFFFVFLHISDDFAPFPDNLAYFFYDDFKHFCGNFLVFLHISDDFVPFFYISASFYDDFKYFCDTLQSL